MFVMINFTVFIHQINARLTAKSDKYPLRLVLLRFLEIGGKVIIIPAVLMTFFWTFTDFGPPGIRDTATAMCAIFVTYVFSREIPGFKSDLSKSILGIRAKLENPTEPVSSLEALVYNWYSFRIVSRSQAHFHRWKRDTDQKYLAEGGDNCGSDTDSVSGRSRRSSSAGETGGRGFRSGSAVSSSAGDLGRFRSGSVCSVTGGDDARGSGSDDEGSGRMSFSNPMHHSGRTEVSKLPTGVGVLPTMKLSVSDSRSTMHEL